MNKKALFIALAAAVVGTTLFASTKAYAQEVTNVHPMSQLVQKIATKFGLQASDVQAVFDQDRTDRKAEMEKKFEETLIQAVVDGKLTEAQKQLILAKNKELEASRTAHKPEDMQGKTEEERKAAMEANKTKMEVERKALEEWATQNGIDTKYLMGGFGKGPRGEGSGGPPPDGVKAPDSTITPKV